MGWLANIPRMEARRWRREKTIQSEVTGKLLYYMTLAETGSKEKAEQAEKEFIRARLRRNERVEE